METNLQVMSPKEKPIPKPLDSTQGLPTGTQVPGTATAMVAPSGGQPPGAAASSSTSSGGIQFPITVPIDPDIDAEMKSAQDPAYGPAPSSVPKALGPMGPQATAVPKTPTIAVGIGNLMVDASRGALTPETQLKMINEIERLQKALMEAELSRDTALQDARIVAHRVIQKEREIRMEL